LETLFDKQRILSTAIDLWRKSLVSFDGNNRQIYYRFKKVGDVSFDDKYVDQEILEKLLQENKVRVSALYPELVMKINAKSVEELAGLDQVFDEGSDEQDSEKDLAKLWALLMFLYFAGLLPVLGSKNMIAVKSFFCIVICFIIFVVKSGLNS
jgi:hypothetical protein